MLISLDIQDQEISSGLLSPSNPSPREGTPKIVEDLSFIDDDNDSSTPQSGSIDPESATKLANKPLVTGADTFLNPKQCDVESQSEPQRNGDLVDTPLLSNDDRKAATQRSKKTDDKMDKSYEMKETVIEIQDGKT